MSGPRRVAPAVKRWAFEQVTAVFAGRTPTVLVDWSDVGEDSPDDAVVIGSVSSAVAPLALMGGFPEQSMREEGLLDVTITTFGFGAGAEMADVEARAFDMLADVEAVFWADPTCGGLCVVALPEQAASECEFITEGCACTLTTRVRFTATV